MQVGFKIRLYGKIICVNLKHNFLLPFGAALCAVIMTPLFFNINALQSAEAARPIEFWLCFVGAILLVPVFLPEQDKDIKDVICSRKFDYAGLCAIRLFYSVVAMIILIVLFVGMMKFCECDVRGYHVLGGVASAWFLGTLGFAAAGLTGNITTGCMVTVFYYLANYGLKEKLGKFFLFSMSCGGEAEESGWLIGGAVLLTILTLGVIKYRHKCRNPFIKYGNG